MSENDSAKTPSPKVISANELVDLLFDLYPDKSLKSTKGDSEILTSLKRAHVTHYETHEGKQIKINKDSIRRIIEDTLASTRLRMVRQDKQTIEPAFEDSFQARLARVRTLFDLKEVFVVRESEYGDQSSYGLAKQAAEAFRKIVGQESGVPTIAIGGGQTMHRMLWWLSPETERPMRIVATNFVTRVPEDQVFDSSYLAMHVHWLCHKSTAQIISIPPLPRDNHEAAAKWHRDLFNKNAEIRRAFESGLDPDIVFIGAGAFHEDSPTISRLYSRFGIDYQDLVDMPSPPVGDINLCLFDAHGRDLTPDVLRSWIARKDLKWRKEAAKGTLFSDSPFCHPFLVGLNIERLKLLVAGGKKVILVAGGNGAKSKAVAALLSSKVINGIVTDSGTIDGLLSAVG